MKKICLILISVFINILPGAYANIVEEFTKKETPHVFIYHIPDDEQEQEISKTNNAQDIISDDITEDTSGVVVEEAFDNNNNDDDEIKKIVVDENGYEVSDMYSDILKGYAVYEQGEENMVSLDTKNSLKIKIQEPYSFKGGKYLASKSLTPSIYSKFSEMEYSIKPLSGSLSKNIRSGLSAGTMFNQGIDSAELEQSTGVFSRYDTNRFGIYTAFSKTINSTNSNYNDKFYFSPELKLNQYFTIKEIFSTDITSNRKKAELVLSINPFGKKDFDRLRIDFGANATYDDNNALMRNQFKFFTNFKL